MKIAARELNLLGITAAVVLLALTYLALEPKFQEWTEFRAQREDLLARQETAQELLASRETVEARLAEFRQGLPVFPAGKKAEAELLLALEKSLKGLQLTRSEADVEREAGDLYETALTGYWEGDLRALVDFLYAQQAQGAVADVRQLSVQPAGGQGAPIGRLKGTFTIDYAYRRETGATESKPESASPEPAVAAEQPERTTP
jgi:type II secretory pathway pseudopilin PulG